MDWKDAVGEVAKYAPSVATALGGPPAGGITKGATDFVTGLLGIDDSPGALVGATQDPDKRAELVRINNEHKARLERMRFDAQAADAAEKTARLAETQKTMRSELDSDSMLKSGWRGFIGWVFGVSLLGVMASIVYNMFTSDASPVELLQQAVMVLGIMATVLGIDINRVGRERLVSKGVSSPTFMDAVKTRVAGK
ncbi:3TM-type holin [Chromohalobacter canadensis]|uniref:3TM-type holin n=1 Tax=Chromohalobacter canadensis TaxID=141389 RepID=UPI00241015DA|nr:3TM-type holin [Chromohalobacter canadensis]